MINLNGRIYDIVIYTSKTGKKATLSCMNEYMKLAGGIKDEDRIY